MQGGWSMLRSIGLTSRVNGLARITHLLYGGGHRTGSKQQRNSKAREPRQQSVIHLQKPIYDEKVYYRSTLSIASKLTASP